MRKISSAELILLCEHIDAATTLLENKDISKLSELEAELLRTSRVALNIVKVVSTRK